MEQIKKDSLPEQFFRSGDVQVTVWPRRRSSAIDGTEVVEGTVAINKCCYMCDEKEFTWELSQRDISDAVLLLYKAYGYMTRVAADPVEERPND